MCFAKTSARDSAVLISLVGPGFSPARAGVEAGPTIRRNRRNPRGILPLYLFWLVVFLITSTSTRPSEWNSPPVAVLAVVRASAGVT
jgi:hypothetical protein